MDRRTSLGGRLSLSTSNLSSPLAESTQVNGSSLQPKFPWGGKMSPARSTAAPNSPSILKKTAAPKVMLSPIRRIDPRVYTDVQSNGLTSRIVKYHENSAKLNRSMSVGNIYNRPGEYPVVHLKKNAVHVKPRQNPSISVVRIAPPDRSLYQNNVRSSILRTGSLIPPIELDRADEKDSRDNRPILPPAENDDNPTRSVLDALKEISRKRINSDDVDCSDSIKKYCKENDEDPRRHLRLSLTNIASQSQQVSVITKRQREITTPTESITSSPDKTTAILKRPCTKNNDILSSLSSSISISTPKRKLQDFQGRPPIGRYSPSIQNLAPPNAKQHCNDRNFASTSSTAKNVYDYPPDQLTPIPATPAVETKQPSMVAKKPDAAPAPPAKPRLTLFNKDYDTTPIIRQPSEEARLPEEEGIAGISFIKPKKSSAHLSGRNALVERVQSSKLSLMLSCLSGDFNDSEDDVDSNIKEKPAEPTSALASMLATTSSSLVVTYVGPTVSTTTISTTSVTSSSTSISAPSIVSALMQTPVSTAPAPAFSFGLKPTVAANSTDSKADVSETTKTSESTSQPSFSFGIAAATNANDTKSNAATITTTAVPAPTFGSTFGSSQPNSGLNITASETSTSSVTTTSTPVTSVSSGFAFGQQNSATTFPSIASKPPPASISASNTSLVSFGSPNTQQVNVTSGASSTTLTPSSSGIAFPATTMATGLSFGNSAPAFGMPTSTKSQTAPMFSFSSPATTTPATLSATISAPSSNISFGSSLSKPVAVFGSSVANTTMTSNPSMTTQQQPTPTFGSIGASAFNSAGVTDSHPPKFGEAAKPSGSFTLLGSTNNTIVKFGEPQQSTPNVASSIFGSVSTNAPATTTTSAPSFNFGSSVANKPVSSTPSFNFNATTTSSNKAIPLFGSTSAPSTTAGSTVSTFGATVQQPTQLTQAASNQSVVPFGFGASNQQSQQPAAGPFSFGGNTAPTSTPFGFGNQSAVNATQPQTTKSFSFGGGSGASAFTAVNTNKPASGGFSFNLTAATPSESKNVFGAIQTSQTATPFSFSNTASNPPQQQPTPLFGSPPTNNANPPVFGAPAMTPGKLFSFGAAPANNNNSSGNTGASNIFGSSSLNNNSTTTPLFPAANNITQSPFGAPPTATKSAPAFNFAATGPTANNNNSSTNTTFNFGATSALQGGGANKTFSVNTTPAAAPSDNIFGSKPPSFIFPSTGSNGVLANSLVPVAPANPFNPTKSGSEPPKTIQGREIRTATRRLKPK